MALLPLIFLLGVYEWLPFSFAELSATAMLGLLGNAMVCGIVSNPHDRYGARIVWIAAFIVLLAMAQAIAQARGARARPLPNAQPLFY
jgi:hypothetical protein